MSGFAMSQTSASEPIGFRVRIGHTVLPASTERGALRAAIEQANRGYTQPGLPDALNPDVIDVDKAAALVAALPAIAKLAPQLLAGRELLLNHAPLRIGVADPTTAASFAQPFMLQVVDVQGETLLARSTVPLVPEMARARAIEAKAQLAAESERVGPLEARLQAAEGAVDRQRAVLDELTPALQRRSALARTWWSNARALGEAPDADAAAKADAAAALKAVDDYLLPGGGGMSK